MVGEGRQITKDQGTRTDREIEQAAGTKKIRGTDGKAPTKAKKV